VTDNLVMMFNILFIRECEILGKMNSKFDFSAIMTTLTTKDLVAE